MKTSNDILSEAKDNLPKYGFDATWFELAYQLKVSESSMHGYRVGKAAMPEKYWLRLAKFVPYPKSQLLFWCAAERCSKSVEMANALSLVEQQMAGRWKEGHRANA